MTDARFVVALDVGGTTMKGAVVDADGVSTHPIRWSTPAANGPEAVVDAVVSAAKWLVNEHPDAAALGLVVPGFVDESRGIALYSENIGWRDVAFPKLVAAEVGLPIGFGHDVRAGGKAERRFGSGDEYANTFFVPIGTGISGAIFVDGHFLESQNAGEIGHISVGFPDACVCGASGCLEAVASGASILRRFRAAGGTGADDAQSVVAFAREGNATATSVWADAIEALARALTTYISLLAPELIVLGGGVSQAGDDLLVPLQARLDQLLTWQDKPQLVLSSLGERAGTLGASMLAFDALTKKK